MEIQLSDKQTQSFWAKVGVGGQDECWLWTGALGTRGYGVMAIGRRRVALASHLSLILDGRQRPEAPRNQALHALHCTSKSCVNPAHLRWGSHKENMEDASALGLHKGFRPRAPGYVQPPRMRGAKLSREDAELIRSIPKGTRGVAKRFGITPKHLCSIRQGRAWREPSAESSISPAPRSP